MNQLVAITSTKLPTLVAVAGACGCGCAKRAASGKRCRAITISRNTSQPISTVPGWATVQREGCSLPIGRGASQLTLTGCRSERLAIIGRLAVAHGIGTKLGNHSFRSTGITAYLKNGPHLKRPRR